MIRGIVPSAINKSYKRENETRTNNYRNQLRGRKTLLSLANLLAGAFRSSGDFPQEKFIAFSPERSVMECERKGGKVVKTKGT